MTNVYATFWFNKTDDFIPLQKLRHLKEVCKEIRKKAEVSCFLVVYNDVPWLTKKFLEDTDINIVSLVDICPLAFLPVFADGNDITLMNNFGKHVIVNWILEKFQNTKDKIIVSEIDPLLIPKNENHIPICDWFISDAIWGENLSEKYLILDNVHNDIYLFYSNSELKELSDKFLKNHGEKLMKNFMYLGLDHKAYFLSPYYKMWDHSNTEAEQILFDEIFKKDLQKFNKTFLELRNISDDILGPLISLDENGLIDNSKHYRFTEPRFPFNSDFNESGLSDEGNGIYALLNFLNKPKSKTDKEINGYMRETDLEITKYMHETETEITKYIRKRSNDLEDFTRKILTGLTDFTRAIVVKTKDDNSPEN